MSDVPPRRRKPSWLKVKAPAPRQFRATGALLDELELHTVCREARCPNKGECYSSGTATFLILGDACTRACRFCSVAHADPASAAAAAPTRAATGLCAVDADEPRRVAEAARRLGLRHVVITSVTRDDLQDGGASGFAAVVKAVRAELPAATVEVLIPDMGGDEAALAAVLAARPDVLNHNLETVARLYAEVRPQADYERSLQLLRRAAVWARDAASASSAGGPYRARAQASVGAAPARPLVKSGLMVGLGERTAEVEEVLSDCAAAGVDAVTIGQYLQPDAGCLPVARYVEPTEFAFYEKRGAALGLQVAAAPFVRSSYRAGELLERPAGRGAALEHHAGSVPMTPAGLSLPLPTPELVMFDLDYTLLRPSDQFEAPGYVHTGARFGLRLDAGRWPQAERAAYAAVKARRRETGEAHDDGLLEVIARAVIEGLGGGDAERVAATIAAIASAWSRAENFGLYDDVMPCLRTLRASGVRAALVSNALGHSLEEVLAHFALDDFICTSVSSADVGVVKPAAAMFETMLARLDVAPEDAVMVGDSAEDDVSGALACGCGAILLDRSGRAVGTPLPRIESLAELPAALGL